MNFLNPCGLSGAAPTSVAARRAAAKYYDRVIELVDLREGLGRWGG
jgi:hypothetical protein